MAEGIKISELTEATTINDRALFPLVQNGENESVEFSTVKDEIKKDVGAYNFGSEHIIGMDNGSTPVYRRVYRNITIQPNTVQEPIKHTIIDANLKPSNYRFIKCDFIIRGSSLVELGTTSHDEQILASEDEGLCLVHLSNYSETKFVDLVVEYIKR